MLSDTDDIVSLMEADSRLLKQIGDCPNIEIKVNPNSLFWRTVDKNNGYLLQRGVATGNGRIVGSDGKQKAYGNMAVMQEKFKRLSRASFFEPGDVIGVSRAGFYDHYAIYMGAGKVIHYAGEGDDFGGKISIHEADLGEFMKKSTECFVVCVIDGKLIKIRKATAFLVPTDLHYATGYAGYHNHWEAFSNEETVERARSRIGENAYNIVTNNCEHFALWCKTGKSFSTQVKQMLNYVSVTANLLEQNSIASFGYE